MPVPTTFIRLLCRTLKRAITREEIFNGNRESIRTNFFNTDSILLWLFQTHSKREKLYRELNHNHADIPIKRFTTLKKVNQFLSNLNTTAPAPQDKHQADP